MPDTSDPTATLTADPEEGEEAGSQSLDPNLDTGVGERRTMPDEAYKGLQRRIEQRDRENATLRQQIDELRNRPASQQNDEAILQLLQALSAKDPEAARVMAGQIRQQRLESENQTLRSEAQTREQREQIARVEQENLNALRGVAADLGANPDSPLIDYGDSTMYLHERMARVRESAKKAAGKATPVTPPARTPAQTHNTQPGVPPTPKAKEQPVTQVAYQAALSDYRRKPSRDKATALETMRTKLMEQQLAAITD